MSTERGRRLGEQQKLLTKLYKNLSTKDRINVELVVQLAESRGLSITPSGSALKNIHYKDIDFFVLGSRSEAREFINELIENHRAKIIEKELDPLAHYMSVAVFERYKLQINDTKIDIAYCGFSS